MVCRCVAAGCSKSHKEGAVLCSFPKDAGLRKKWADQVKGTRDKWEPTEHSRLCHDHFEDSCFEADNELSKSVGLGRRKPRLKAGVVPTIFEKAASLKRKIPAAESQAPKAKRRSAYEKQERSRVCEFGIQCMAY